MSIEQRLTAIEAGQQRIESLLSELLSALIEEDQEAVTDLNGQPSGRARDENQEL
jgi:hypothetical protein